jgi:hypothetical protein
LKVIIKYYNKSISYLIKILSNLVCIYSKIPSIYHEPGNYGNMIENRYKFNTFPFHQLFG